MMSVADNPPEQPEHRREGSPVIRVIIVDDQPLVRSGIAMLLSAVSDIEVVGEAGDGHGAVVLTRSRHPDVVLMDVRMPGMDGVAATSALIEEGLAGGADSLARIVMLSTYNVDEAVYAALRAGAVGFVLKDAAPEELVAAVRAVDAGEGWLDPGVTRRLIEEFAARPTDGLPAPELFAQLTPRESEVLVLIAHGLTNLEIAAHLIVGEATVKTHVQRILFKLHLRDRVQAVIVAYESGLVQPGSPVPAPSNVTPPRPPIAPRAVPRS
jgi:DNA-binding NarL/FixJ family response regulator